MTWASRFAVREYVKGSLWVLPLVGAVLGGLLAEALADLGASGPWDYSASTASTFLSAVVGATAALTGFVITVTVLVVQMAIGTFSARYMRLWFRDRMLKATLALLIGTLTFSFGLLRRIGDEVPDIAVTVAGSLMVLSLLLFLFFFDRFLHRLRPVAVAALAAEVCREAIDDAVETAAAPEVYLEPSGEAGEPTLRVRAERAGSIQALDVGGLVAWASRHESELVLRYAVGDFVPAGATLMHVHAPRAATGADERNLRGMVAIGEERTVEQDPSFAVRVMVDVAIRALSPAVNDPTTAVQVIDYLGETLRQIGTAGFAITTQVNRAPGGAAVVIHHRRWDDFLALGVTEIREYGVTSIQVMRRLRAMLEELRESVPPEHRAAVDDQLARLDASVAERWGESVDLDLARSAGPQGIGGPSAWHPGPER
jgi:uncharacterized membrane protein